MSRADIPEIRVLLLDQDDGVDEGQEDPVQPEVTDANGNDEEHPVEVKVYKKRWYILFLFSLLGIYQGMIWNSFGPISESLLVVFCPEWSAATLAMLGNWGNIMYILPILPVMWFFETKGLRAGILVTGVMMTLGTLLRCLPLDVTGFTWMCHLCAILNGISGIVIFSAPSALSAAWFPPNERTTATGIAIVFNNLGNAMSFLLGPNIVHGPNGNSTQKMSSSMFPMRDALDPMFENDTCPAIKNETRIFIEKRIDTLMYTEFGLVATCFLAILIYFPSKPKLPPSLTSSMERMDFFPGVKKIMFNRNALIMTLSFSFFNGLIASWYSVMNITFSSLPIGDDKDQVIGYIGMWAIIGNSVATILVSRFVDSIKGRMKLTLLVLMTTALCCWIWLGLLCLQVIHFSLLQLYISTILASALTYATGPIFFEFTVELVYPVPEGLVGAYLTCWYNSVGMVFLLLFYVPAVASNPNWIPYAIMFSTSLSVPLLLLVKEEYNRSVIDDFQEPSANAAEHSSYPEIS